MEKLSFGKFRKQVGLSQQQMADILKCSRSTISMIENGNRTLGHARDLVLKSFASDFVDASFDAESIIPSSYSDEEMMKMLREQIFDLEKKQMAFINIEKTFIETRANIIAKYTLARQLNNDVEIDKDYHMRKLGEKYRKLFDKRMNAFLAIKAKYAYVEAIILLINIPDDITLQDLLE
jgi:transcriptional regulator with XRE-family HTH domain